LEFWRLVLSLQMRHKERLQESGIGLDFSYEIILIWFNLFVFCAHFIYIY
jgi:hypothetical protein